MSSFSQRTLLLIPPSITFQTSTYIKIFLNLLLRSMIPLCYTTPTSNFGHDIFIMFQRPWKSLPRISFLNFIAFSAKNSLRFLMMLLIHRNFKCPCTCISCMHTGQMLRYFWNFNKYILYKIHFRKCIFIQFLYCLFILTMLKYIQKVFSLHLLREERYGNYQQDN